MPVTLEFFRPRIFFAPKPERPDHRPPHLHADPHSLRQQSMSTQPAKSAHLDPELQTAEEFLSFVNGCHSEFHAVAVVSGMLLRAGFTQISEREDSDWGKVIRPGKKYFFTRNQSSIIAFAVGKRWRPGGGFVMAGAHTDSPVLKVKPVSKTTKSGFLQVGVEPYGGGLWNTWFDRNLTVAGRVIVESAPKGPSAAGRRFECKLVHVPRPILYIPNLAIHLNRSIYTEGFKYNKQKHLLPVIATEQLNQPSAAAASEENEKKDKGAAAGSAGTGLKDEHHSLLVDLLAKELKVPATAIKDFDLSLCDTQPACIHGAHNEFIASRGLDNLLMSFVCTKSLIDATDEKALAEDGQVRLVALFDNEEIGSRSQQGAASCMMSSVLKRINNDAKSYDAAIRKSFLVSADMAHALHPNYPEKHEENHRPMIHKGLVIKKNGNQRYATNSVTTFLIEEIARRFKIPVQKFVVRNDMGCGSTIGPIISANTGVRTVDVGIPQFAMHSIREMCGTKDVYSSYQLIKNFFLEFAKLDESLTVDGPRA